MPFPLYHAGLFGDGMVIGGNAVLHVVISHGVAIGMFTVLLLLDHLAPRPLPDDWRALLHRLLRVTTVLATVAGAVTGAGIWFTTATLAPRAVASMLRVFYWPWFVEWLAFVAEVILLLVLYFRWDRLDRARRAWLGLAYLGVAFASAFLISGILGFMLTPGSWSESHGLADAFFNASFPPQLLARLALGVMLGAVGVLLVVHLPPRSSAAPAAERIVGRVLAIATPLLFLMLAWYLTAIPIPARERTGFSLLTSHLSRHAWLPAAANIAAVLLLMATAVAATTGRRRAARWLLAPALVAAVGVAAELERVREFIRGPYLMPGYMYANQTLLAERPLLERVGFSGAAAWTTHPARAGSLGHAAFVFGSSCGCCHTIGGINDITDRLHGRSADGIAVILDHTHELVPFMPPLAASPDERRLLARYLFLLANDRIEMASRSRHIPEAGP